MLLEALACVSYLAVRYAHSGPMVGVAAAPARQASPLVPKLSTQASINSAALGQQAPLHRRQWSRSRLKIDAFFANIVEGRSPLRDG
jgi:hypothetical protein